MPVPKKRHSKSRTSKRRATWKIKVSPTTVCSVCSSPKLPYTACPSCGDYRGRTAIKIKEDKKKKKKEK